MNISFENGRIVTTGILCDEVPYDVSNNGISVQFNGKGGVNSYLKINNKKNFSGMHVFKFFINGEEIPFNTEKRVESIGRTQTVTYYNRLAQIKTVSVLDENISAVIMKIEIEPKENISLDLAVFMRGAISENCTQLPDGSIASPGNGFAFASDAQFTVSGENESLLLSDYRIDKPTSINIVYGFKFDEAADVLKNADKYIESAFEEINSVVLPSSVKSEEDKALYYSAYFCALENYKEIGDFKGFMAGCKYI